MPQPDDSSEEALRRLDQKLDALQARRAASAGGESLSAGYRLVGEVIGGVLGGLGVGLAIDHFAHTQPWGVIGGLAVGAVISVSAAAITASRVADRMRAEPGASQDAGREAEDEET